MRFKQILEHMISQEVKRQLNEDNRPDWYDEFEQLRRSYYKKFIAMPGGKIIVKAAKDTAKIYKIKYQDILKTVTPPGSIQGDVIWDKRGNITGKVL